MEDTVRALLAGIIASPILVFPDWETVTDKSRPLRLYYDASTAGFGGTLEQGKLIAQYAPLSTLVERLCQ